MIPTSLALQVLAAVNCGVILAVGHVLVEEGLVGAFIREITGDSDVALALVDGHGAGLDDRLAVKVALGGLKRPCSVQGGMIVGEGEGGQEQCKCKSLHDGNTARSGPLSSTRSFTVAAPLRSMRIGEDEVKIAGHCNSGYFFMTSSVYTELCFSFSCSLSMYGIPFSIHAGLGASFNK